MVRDDLGSVPLSPDACFGAALLGDLRPRKLENTAVVLLLLLLPLPLPLAPPLNATASVPSANMSPSVLP